MGRLEEQDHHEVHSTPDIDTNPKEERDKIEEKGYAPMHPCTPLITTGVGLVSLQGGKGQGKGQAKHTFI